jgi:hypothetical protein
MSTTSPEERRLREDLAALAGTARGRRLLQMALRGIGRGEQEVTAGCWREHGSAGCLFQHAYWEGVREGVFPDEGRPGDWVGSFVGTHGYGLVINVIASFDRLARTSYAEAGRRRLPTGRVRIRHGDFQRAVETLLVDALRSPPAAPAIRPSRIHV